MTATKKILRKPVGWKNTFDEVLSLKKCPPGENLPEKYRDDFKFIGSGAGSLDLVQKPCVFDKDGVYQDRAIVLLLKTNVTVLI